MQMVGCWIKRIAATAGLAAAVGASLSGAPSGALAQAPAGLPLTGVEDRIVGGDPDLPFLLEADSVRFDQPNDTVYAEGNVQISRDGRSLTADQVEFRRGDKILAATGNVVLVETSGEVLFADEVELTESLDQGYAIAPRILLPNGSRLAARGAKRLSKDRFEVYRGVYSPCVITTICGVSAPLWQLRAARVSHSDTRRQLEFRDATLDVFGVPVAWLPYFSQPDPRVRRKTGFLVPTLGSDGNLGQFARVPFFWNIAPNQDLTFSPIITSREYPVALGEYRHLFPWGRTTIQGSFGMVERRENADVIGTSPRGHIKWTGDANINEHWRATAQLYRSSDDTYLRRFKIDSAGVLRSFATAEGFYRRGYINATTFSVQEQRVNFTENDTPEALPYITAAYGMPLGETGFYLTGAASLSSLFRTNGADSQHISAEIGIGREWELAGHLFEARASVRSDLFSAQDIDSQSDVSGSSARLLPRTTVGWSYPVFRPIGESAVLTLTPRVMGTATVGSANSAKLPNEDSQSVEFDSTALFRPELAAGRDRFDDGQRIDVGLEATLDVEGARFMGLVGQSYRVGSSRNFGPGTGLDRPFSDIVVGAGARIDDWFDGATRLRWDTRDGSISAAETRLRVGRNPIQLALTHTMLDARTVDGLTLDATQQIDASLRVQLTDHWAGFGRHQRDLESGRPLRSQIGISYADECFRFETVFSRNSFENAEVKNNDSIIFRIAFRQLGGTSSNQSFNDE